ncbi:LPD25 domain-containing protein [Halalkalibacter alkalisediminis]|uniref:LPD25 domain-containing protein n=1 Tax=Halalkalibacter alkalisediminis TaxID=935616 RepID=A0ABV6NJM2_9BACI|nr:LPD25 domain-containing protein [Halalkalibacter alkalisediminis]
MIIACTIFIINTEDHTQINDKLALLEEVKGTSYEFITHLEDDLVKTNEREIEKESEQNLQQKLGNIEVILRDEVKKVSDLTPEEFQGAFYDKHNRNVLNNKEFQGLDPKETIDAFNNLNDKWNAQMDIVKMIHPDMKEPQAYVVWSETNIDHRLMKIKDMDMTLAKANIDSFKTPGYDKTRVNFVVPDENGIHVKRADRIDLGDGMYHNLHDYLKSVQPSLAKYVPQTNNHLKDIYSKEVISTTVERIYKENLYLKHANVKDELAMDVSDSDVQVIEHYAIHHNYLSKGELDSLKSNVYEKFTNDKEQMDTTNIMVHLKGHYEKYQSHLQAENKGELTEEKVVNRMKAENQYTDVKYLALKSNVVDERMIDRMESSIKDCMTNSSTKKEAKEKDSPFQKSPIQQKNIGLSM